MDDDIGKSTRAVPGEGIGSMGHKTASAGDTKVTSKLARIKRTDPLGRTRHDPDVADGLGVQMQFGGNYGDYFAYSPIVDRPPIRWPGNARIALWIVPNVEYYQFKPPPNPYRRAWPRVPYVKGYSWRDYGNRVGFWRIMDVLDGFGIRATASVNMAVLEHFHEICDAMVKRDWELMSHGLYNTQYLFGLSVEQERALIAETIEILHRQTGKQLKGMFGPGASITPNTMDLMAEMGLVYSADWYVDDQPFPISVKSGRLVCVPYTWELNDGLWMTEGYGKGIGTLEADAFMRMCIDQFDVLYEEGEQSGRVMCIALHTSIFGSPHRIRYLEDTLSHILSHDRVWVATGSEIAEYYLEHYYDQFTDYLRRFALRSGS